MPVTAEQSISPYIVHSCKRRALNRISFSFALVKEYRSYPICMLNKLPIMALAGSPIKTVKYLLEWLFRAWMNSFLNFFSYKMVQVQLCLFLHYELLYIANFLFIGFNCWIDNSKQHLIGWKNKMKRFFDDSASPSFRILLGEDRLCFPSFPRISTMSSR